jgi:lipopolysaccharide biosynthesis regulator YciM
MGAALVLLLVTLGALAAGVLIGRYYVPDDRQLRRTARHSRAYMRALSHLIARDYETVMAELRAVVEENVEDVEPYFALGAIFRSRGEHERAIRVHQALAVRERDRRKLRHRAMYELGLDFRAAGMPRRATRAMETVLVEEPAHEGALRALAALYEEQARFNEAAGLWQRLGRRRGEDMSHREHHLLVAAAQAALGREDLDSAKQLLKAAQKIEESAHFFAAAAELAAARGNHRGARERLKQALVADPGLTPHLLPGLIAAEQQLAAAERAGHKTGPDDLDEEAAEPAPPLADAVRSPLLAATGGEISQGRALPAAGGTQTGASQGAAGSPAASERVGIRVPSPGSAAGRTGEGAIGAPPATPGAVPTGAMPGGAPVGDSASPGAAPGGVSPANALAISRGAVVPASAGGAPTAGGGAGSSAVALTLAAAGALIPAAPEAAPPIEGVPLVPSHRPAGSIAERVIAVIAKIEAEIEVACGPRLEIALIRAQLVPPVDSAGQAELAEELAARFPDALAARVAAARLALMRQDPAAIRGALDGLVSEAGALAWTLRGRWQCSHCGHRPGPFHWRCAQCRRWNTLRMETGIEPPPVQPRERRAAPRGGRPEGLLGAPPDQALPAATLDPGLSDAELATAGTRRSLLGRVGGWFSGAWRRDAP